MKFLVTELPKNCESCPLIRMVQVVDGIRIGSTTISPDGKSITAIYKEPDSIRYEPYCSASGQPCNLYECDKYNCSGMIVFTPPI